MHPVPTPPPASIETRGLTRRFDRQDAVSGVDLSVGPGDCLAIFGPNGAGKTTLLRLLAGLLNPSDGLASVAGVRLPGGPAARAQVGLISHHSMLYPALTARENVEFAARLYGLPAPRASAESALGQLGVLDRADVPVRVLSRGLQQRVSIARSFVHAPRVVLLDEPYTGLDATGAAALSSALEGLKARGAALVLVTHHLDEGLAIATHVAIMRAGRFVMQARRDAVDPALFAGEYRAAVGVPG